MRHNDTEIDFRQAQPVDAAAIARLHVQSWRRTYRGLFTVEFLNNEAESNRRLAWNQRLASQRADQFVCVAEQGGEIIGFVCAYGCEHPMWGSLIDNLHVQTGHQRQRVGTGLMARAFEWLQAYYPDYPVYLWVMARNAAARQFYHQLGAVNSGVFDKTNPVGGGSALNCRYVWENPAIKKDIIKNNRHLQTGQSA